MLTSKYIKQRKRCGVVVINDWNGKLSICVGEDKTFGELGHFAGGALSSDQNDKDSAMREFNEETLSIFDESEIEHLCHFTFDNDYVQVIGTKVCPELKESQFLIKSIDHENREIQRILFKPLSLIFTNSTHFYSRSFVILYVVCRLILDSIV